jgi:hypothetical protein
LKAILLAAGLRCGRGGEVRRELVGGEGFDFEGDEAELGDAEVHRAVGAIDDHRHSDDFALVGANDVHGFFNATALGDDVFDYQNSFARFNFEAAAQSEFAFFFLDENEAGAELACDFLADHEAAHRRRDHGGWREGFNLIREGVAEAFDDGHLLEGEGALEKLAAMQAAAEDEMSFEERTGIAKNLKHVGLCHRERKHD